MTEVSANSDSSAVKEAAVSSPSELRAARASLLESISLKLTDLVTAIIANCDMAATSLDTQHPALAFLVSAKQAAYKAHEANGRVRALVKECREANR